MRFVIDAVGQLEDIDLTGDVEIVNVRGETGLASSAAPSRRRGRAMQDTVMPSSARTSDV
jgi:hypothetical protein